MIFVSLKLLMYLFQPIAPLLYLRFRVYAEPAQQEPKRI